MPTKSELESQLSRRDRDPVVVSVAVAVPVMVVGGLLLLAVLYMAATRAAPSGTFPAWIMAMPGVIAWLIAHSQARAYFHHSIYGRGPAEVAIVLAALAGAAAATWEVWTARVGPGQTWPWLAMGGALGTVLFWGLTWWASKRERPLVAPLAAPDVDHAMPWDRLLARADGRTVITDVRHHRAGVTLTCEPARIVNAGGAEEDADVTFSEFALCAERFATLAAAEYRRRIRQRKRLDPSCTDPSRMPNNCVRPEPGSDDAEFLLHVSMRDVFTEHAPFVPASASRSIYQPIDLGEYEDATRIEIVVAHKSAKIVGHSGAGKSVEANCWIARITECADALVWVGGTDKLVPLIWPWLRSWFAGQSVSPVLDYVAGQDPQRLLEMLADAYKLVCERNARLTDESRLACTKTEPAVFVFIEEMSHAVEFSDTIETHDGMTCDVSTLVMLIARAGRSAGVQIVIMSQSALHGAAGDCASEIIRNIQIRVCLRTMEAHDGTRTIPALTSVDTTIIPLYTKIVQPSVETTRAMPGKAPELDGTRTIDPIAIRNATYRPRGVEAESALTKNYADRWNPQRHPQLARAVQKHGLAWRIPDPPVTPLTTHGRIGRTGGAVMDTAGVWTAQDDVALNDLLDDDTRVVGGFRFPNGDAELARLHELARDIVENGLDDEPGEEPQPLPPPLDRIYEWIVEQEDKDELAPFYLTDTIAKGIGHPDPKRLGAEIQRHVGFRSRNARRWEDAGQRKGWDTDALSEAFTRLRFGL